MNSYDKIYTLLVEAAGDPKKKGPPRSGALPAFDKQSAAGSNQMDRGAELTKRAEEAEDSGSYANKLHAKIMRKVANKYFRTARRNYDKADRSYKLIPPKKADEGLLEYREKPKKPDPNKPAWKMLPGHKKDIDKGDCPWCKKPVGEFKDAKSEKEFGISGVCQSCQDDFFKG